MNGSEPYVPLPATVLVLVKTDGGVQAALSGPKRVKVMVPVGSVALARVAASATWPPTATDGDAWVVRVATGAPVTTTDSLAALHGLVTATWLASPLYEATHR